MSEMIRLERFREEVPRPDSDALRGQEERLLSAIAAEAPLPEGNGRPRRRFAVHLRVGLAAGLAAAALTAGGVVFLLDAEQKPAAVIHTMPMNAEKTLTRAAEKADEFPELRPRPGQYLVFESQTMEPVEANDADGHHRYLVRGRSKVWMPFEGDSTHGFSEGVTLKPRPYPGWPIPPGAWEGVGVRTGPEKAADFDQRAEYLRTDYAYVSRLPTDPAKMYQHLYTGLKPGPEADLEAWNRVGGLLAGAYLPAAQRAALFRAAAAIPGVVGVGKAVDAAGRTGIAAARVDPWLGVREEYIFDSKTYGFLGNRRTVVDARLAEAPVGSVLTSNALVKVSLVDRAPVVKGD
ncbi:hypothetical protein SAMN05421505_102274 [Sinosporangium album]|uniref:Uncharacterized protein n=1 Tax=Sinosporangium album TaxID=504805 RepID=A0A1G7SGJ0_9ACTN|nr:CU044_5270 family protein [Sinosporangium album]SDG21330.1 hypothetical protein SAMN05421505_102274 [Sinosporangium album]